MLMPAIRAMDSSQTLESALTLLVPRIGADHTHHALAADDLAVAANFLDRSRNLHFILRKPLYRALDSARPEHDARPRQIVGRQFHRHLVARQDADVVHAHLPRDMTQHDM